jgi:hypothetical protein
MAIPRGRALSRRTRQKIGRTLRRQHEHRRAASAHVEAAILDAVPRSLPPETFGKRLLVKHLRHDAKRIA